MGATMFMRKGLEHTVPGKDVPVNDLAVGSVITIKEQGDWTEYIKIHPGIPANGLYQGQAGIMMLRKNIFANRRWNGDTSNNYYRTSEINAYLSNDFLGRFSQAVSQRLLTWTFPASDGSGQGIIQASVATKVIPLSAAEVGFTRADHVGIGADGVILDYFKTGTPGRRIATLDGSAAPWGLRSNNRNNNAKYWFVTDSGSFNDFPGTSPMGLRPCIILPLDAIVDAGAHLIE